MGFGSFLSSLPVVGSMFDNTGDQAMNALGQNAALYGNIQTPDLKWQKYDPNSVDPTMANASQISEDPSLRSGQLSALSKLSDLSNTGLSDADQAGYQSARNIGNQMESQGNAAALQNAASRGVAGSGMEFAMREQADQDAAQRSQGAGLQQAGDAARQRALYNQAYGQGMSNLRGQDFNANSQNAGILNQFNMANTQAKNQADYYNTGNQNQAQQYNNQGMMNTQQQNFNNQITKAGGQAAANTGLAQGYAAQNAANTSAQNSNAQIGAGLITGKPPTG